MTNQRVCNRLTRQVPQEEEELPTFPGHLSSTRVFFGGIRVTRALVLCVCFEDRCLFLCSFCLVIVLSVPTIN